jgi:hypothetical protein
MPSYGPLASPSSCPSSDARLIPSRVADCGGWLARSLLLYAFFSLSFFGSVRPCTTAGRTSPALSVPFRSKLPFVNLSVRSSPFFARVHTYQKLTFPPQRTSSRICLSFCYLFDLSKASRTSVFAGVSSSSFLHRVRLLVFFPQQARSPLRFAS